MNAIREAAAAAGGPTALARSLGVSAPQAHQWLTGVRKPPPDRCPAIERATEGRVTVEQLRPDVRWARIADPTWPHPGGRPTSDVAAPVKGA